jgi:hypothetical protein
MHELVIKPEMIGIRITDHLTLLFYLFSSRKSSLFDNSELFTTYGFSKPIGNSVFYHLRHHNLKKFELLFMHYTFTVLIYLFSLQFSAAS